MAPENDITGIRIQIAELTSAVRENSTLHKERILHLEEIVTTHSKELWGTAGTGDVGIKGSVQRLVDADESRRKINWAFSMGLITLSVKAVWDFFTGGPKH